MIGYVTMGTNDFAKAAVFYDAIAAEMGGKRAMENDHLILWGGRSGGMLGLIKPHNQQPAVPSNGGMTALAAKDTDQVDRIHALALAQGGTCEGPPGERGGGFYGAYFRDLDGNKLVAFHMAR
jgi:predicted lactoylglutathione lyase